MMLYKITNILNTSLTIEDLGLMLSAGESRRISADAYSKSEDIRRHSRFIKVDAIYAAGNGSIIGTGLEKPIVTAPIQKSNLSSVVISDSDPAKLEKKLDDIYAMLSTLMNQKTTVVVQQVQSKIDPVQQIQTLKEPIFIPSLIVPTNVEFSTQAVEQHIQKDISDSKDALKKLRKK
jgi:hypothetical protein